MAIQPKTGIGSVEETDRLLGGDYFNNDTGAQVKPFTPQVKATNVINSDNLSSTTPMTLSTPPPSTSAVGLGAEISSNIQSEVQNKTEEDALKMQVDTQKTKSEDAKKSAYEQIVKYFGGRKGETALTDEAYTEKNQLGTTVDETAKKLRETNAKITAIDIRANEQIKRLEKNPEGLFGGALQQEISRVQRQASSDKADLYIDQLMQKGDYDSAKSIADRKVDMILEQDKMMLEKLQFDYDENKELFTTAEQRQFELAQADRNRKLDEQKENLKTISDLSLNALKNGAPSIIASQMRNAKTVEEAMQIGGQYVDALDREAQQASIRASNALASQRSGLGADDGTGGILSGLSPKAYAEVIKEADKFSNSPIVKKYNEIVTAANFINDIDPNTDNPASHQAVIYNFAKMLDPDSVVREGEYATVKKYSQSLINKYGGEMKQAISGKGFLSPAAIRAIQEETNNRVNAYKPQYDSVKKQYATRIDNRAGSNVGDSVLLDYEEGYTTPQVDENQDEPEVVKSFWSKAGDWLFGSE